MTNEQLTLWLTRHNLTQAQLADILGVTAKTVSTWRTKGFPRWLPVALKGIEMNQSMIDFRGDLNLFWYQSINYKHSINHVVCYGLDVQLFDTKEAAQTHYYNCLSHAGVI